MDTDRIPCFVLTGGPCAGKTTALSILAQKLPDYGITPIMVPEVASLVLGSGIRIKDIAPAPYLNEKFQRQIIQSQIAFEDLWHGFATIQPAAKKLLLCDRGVMDGGAYVDMREFVRLLHECGLDLHTARDMRYDAIFHLVTAAHGAEKFYSLDNPARYETPAEARARDQLTLSAWTGHRYLRVIGNTKPSHGTHEPIDFGSKMEKLLKEVCRALGIPVPLQIGKRFLVRIKNDTALLPMPSTAFAIEQTYLTPRHDGAERRVRLRAQLPHSDGATADALYSYTEKRKIAMGTWERVERLITEREYSTLLTERDPTRKTILKRRHAFVWEYQYFQLDEFIYPTELFILEIDVTETQNEIIVPPFVEIIREVTDDDSYGNGNLALIK